MPVAPPGSAAVVLIFVLDKAFIDHKSSDECSPLVCRWLLHLLGDTLRFLQSIIGNSQLPPPALRLSSTQAGTMKTSAQQMHCKPPQLQVINSTGAPEGESCGRLLLGVAPG